MKKAWIIMLVMVIGVPLLTSAKTKHLRGYEHSKGKEISVSEPLGWPILVSSKGYLDASIESLPGMTVLKVKGYTPWWQFWGSLPATTTISVAGFPVDTNLHIYTHGYRDHAEVTTNKTGRLMLDVPTKEGRQFIIKATPSTYHINIDTLFGPPGGDCSAIGTWNSTTKTCTLTGDVNKDGNRTIAIEDDNITLDGNGHKVIGIGSDDGVYTDMSNVTVKNLDVSGFARGIVYVASHGLIFSPPTGGSVQSVTLSNLSQNLHIEGMSDINVDGAVSIGADTGLFITDLNLDGFPTYGITVRGSTIKNASTGAYIDNVDPITLTQNNWQGNGTDISQVSSGLILALLPGRGNFWSKFTACTQDPAPANPNHCTNRYNVPDTGVGDTLPWACKDGWKTGVTCSVVTPPPTGSAQWGEVSTTAGIANLYADQTLTNKIKTVPNEWALKVLDSSGDPVKAHDSTDDVDGYIKASDLKIVSAGSARETELQNNAEVVYDTRSSRTPIIIESVNKYYDSSDIAVSLYSVGGPRSGVNNFKKISDNTNFPSGLVMGMIADETGSPAHALNNEICNDKKDGGVGILQTTTKSFKGLGSGMTNISKTNDCDKNYTGTTSKYYSNTYQGIHANIKDAFRIMQIKYESLQVQTALATTSSSFFEGDGLVIDKKDMAAILTTRAFNGFGGSEECFRVNGNDYLKKVGNNTLNIGDFFPSLSYDDSLNNNIAKKLILADKNKTEIYTCSPVYLQVLNSSGKLIAGYNGSDVINTSDRIIYDEEEHKHASIIFPGEVYIYQVVGISNGTYDISVFSSVDGVESHLQGEIIPILTGEVHQYVVDWSSKQVVVKIDKNGDGRFESKFSSDLNLTADEFIKAISRNITICHIPPGNSANAHTISISENAWKAHEKHGDYRGECEQLKKEERSSDHEKPNTATQSKDKGKSKKK